MSAANNGRSAGAASRNNRTRRNNMPRVVENTANSRLTHRNASGRAAPTAAREFHLPRAVEVPEFHLPRAVEVPEFHLPRAVSGINVGRLPVPAVVETSPQIIPADVLLASIQAMTPMEAYEFRVMLDDKHRIIIKNNKRLAEKPALNEKLETFFNKPKLTKKEDIFIRYWWGNEQEVYMLKEYYTKPQPIFPKHPEATVFESFINDVNSITQFAAFEDLKGFLEEWRSLSGELGNRVRELTAVAAGGINPKNIPELTRLIQEDQQNYFNFYQKWYSIITSRSKELGFIS